MPFIPKENFEKLDKQETMNQKIQAKKDMNVINEEANGSNKTGLSQGDQLKIIKNDMRREHSRSKPQQISIKDIERELKLTEMFETKKEDEIEKLLEDSETREIKNELIDVLSIAHTHPDKNKIFKYKLQKSDTINNYVNENVIYRLFNRANSHLKFGTLYTLKYLQTHKEYAQYLKDVQRINDQQEKAGKNAPPEKE